MKTKNYINLMHSVKCHNALKLIEVNSFQNIKIYYCNYCSLFSEESLKFFYTFQGVFTHSDFWSENCIVKMSSVIICTGFDMSINLRINRHFLLFPLFFSLSMTQTMQLIRCIWRQQLKAHTVWNAATIKNEII